jgi:hypothetical protein
MKTKIIFFSIVFATSLTATAFGNKPKSSQLTTPNAEHETNVMAKGSINGLVKDNKNKPMKDVVIVIANTTAVGPIKEIAPMTNAKGEFSLSDLPPGEYTLRANSPGYAPKDKKVIVEATKTSNADFTMTK